MLADRLGMSPQVRAALATNFERWNGRGLPAGRSGADIPRPMRIAQLAHELEVLTRTAGPDQALAVIRERRGHAYDPELADMVLTESSKWHDAIEGLDPWDAALDVSPPGEPLDEEAVRHALLVLADFADLKSPWMGGHSRQVAALVAETCGPAAGAAALVHDLGRVAIPNTIWDKPTHLTRDEREPCRVAPPDHRPALSETSLHPGARRVRLGRPRTPRRLRLPPPAHRRPPRRVATGDRRGRLLPGNDFGPAPPTCPGARRGSGAAAGDGGGRPPRRRSSRTGAGSSRSRQARPIHPTERPHSTRVRGPPSRRTRLHDPTGRRAACHLAQDCRPAHPAHIREDRHLEPWCRCPIRHRERRTPIRPVNAETDDFVRRDVVAGG